MRPIIRQPLENNVDFHRIDVAPLPVLARLKRLDDRVVGSVIVFGGMFVLRTVATAHMATGEAKAQMNPAISHLQALFTAGSFRLHVPNLLGMLASVGHFPFTSPLC